MKKFMYTSVLMLALASSYAQGSQPVLFGRDVISGGDFDFKPAFTPNQKRVYFSRAYNSWSTIIILYSDQNKNNWGEPELVPFSSGTYRDADPFVSYDGSKLYFISDRPGPGEAYKDFAYSIYSVNLDKKGNPVSEPQKITIPVPENINPLYPSVASNGNIYFSAAKDRDQNIYVSEWRDGAYQMARQLEFNSEASVDLDPVVAYNESFLIFTSNRKGAGKMDLWISFNQNGKWSEPVNLGQTINTVESEGQAGLSYDQTRLYFTSLREPKPEKQPNRKITYAQFNRRCNPLIPVWAIFMKLTSLICSNRLILQLSNLSMQTPGSTAHFF